MGQPGQGTSNLNSLIISRPSLQTLRQRVTSTVLKFVFWALWIYLWLPLVTLIAWLLGIDLVHIHMVKLAGFGGLIGVLQEYLITIGLVGAVLACWALYNYLRFRDKTRRKSLKPVTNFDLQKSFQVNERVLADAQKSRFVAVRFNEGGEFGRIIAEDRDAFLDKFICGSEK